MNMLPKLEFAKGGIDYFCMVNKVTGWSLRLRHKCLLMWMFVYLSIFMYIFAFSCTSLPVYCHWIGYCAIASVDFAVLLGCVLNFVLFGCLVTLVRALRIGLYISL